MFTFVDRGTGNRYVVPAKSTNESTVRLLLAVREKEPLLVYTGGFRAYDPLDDDERFHRESVIHANNEYVDGDVHVNTCESHDRTSDPWLSPHRGVSKNKLTHYLRTFQLRRQIYRKLGREALRHVLRKVL